MRSMTIVVVVLALVGCKKDPAESAAPPAVAVPAPAPTRAPDPPLPTPPPLPPEWPTAECALVTADEVSKLLGVPVVREPFDGMPGNHSPCSGHFYAAGAGGKRRQVLMVQEYPEPALFEHPEQIKLVGPVVEQPAGLGADAKLFLPAADVDSAAKSLMLRKGSRLLVLQTYVVTGSAPPQLTKAQLVSLGKLIAGRL
jgi:hypothetical protein